jgi:hypothetical protein
MTKSNSIFIGKKNNVLHPNPFTGGNSIGKGK